MVKTLKEYLGISTIRVGGLDALQPMAALSRKGTDLAPKGKGGKDSRRVGLSAGVGDTVSTSINPTTMKPLNAIGTTSINAKVKDNKKK